MPKVLVIGGRSCLHLVQRFFAVFSFSLLIFQSVNVIVLAAFEQSSYRFLSNLDNANPTLIQSNPSAGEDTLSAVAFDTTNAVFFMGGSDGRWLIDKRSELDGGPVSAFGTSGRVTQDITGTGETIGAMAFDASGGAIYVAGIDYSNGATNSQWRIEKRGYSNGSLISGFGTSGVVASNPTAGNDVVNSIALDTVNGYIYIAGYDSTGANQWRIEKRLMSDGSLASAFGTSGIFTLNPSNQDDRVKTIDLDPTGSYVYVAGFDGSNGNNQWRLDKRRTSDAALCTAANCGTQFGTGGTYTSNPSNRDDNITTLQVDDAGGAIYAGGYDGIVGNNNEEWRIEKLDLSTGALITAFGTSGAVTSNSSANNDEIVDMTLDGAGGYIYVMGFDGTSSDVRWRVEKRQRSDGSLVSAFGTSGAVTSNSSANTDIPTAISIDVERGLAYGFGVDRTLGATNAQWRIEQYQTDNGGYWLGNTNSVAAASTNITFRLRMLLHTTAAASASSSSFKLQVAPKVGTCDTGFIGETYVDVVSGSGEIQYHDNPSLADATTAAAVTGDPTHGSDTNVLETIEELNNFTNPTALSSTNDGLWDFTLQDVSAFGAYCFRAVNSDGTLLTTYTNIPEITFCKDDPKTNNLLRGGTYFCEGVKRSFFWAKD